MKKVFTKEVLIAIAVIVSIGLLYWGINYLKGVNLFTPTNYYTVSFEKVNGLKVSAPVTINGFQVGLVSNVSYDYNDGNIDVELSLDKKLRLPVGSEAMIETDMLGTSTIALVLSNEKDNFYEVGADIPGKLQGGLMDNVSNELLPSVSQLLPKVDSILASVNNLLANPALNESVTRLDQITSNLEQLTSQLNKSVPGIFNNVNTLTEDLKTVSGNLSDMTTELNAVPLDSTMRSINETMANLKEITDALKSDNSSLGLLMNDNGLYNHLDQTVLSLDSLFKDIKTNPKRYINVKVF